MITPGGAEETAVYRLFDTAESLLYVGMSSNPTGRWKGHRRDKAWWSEVASYEIAWYPTRPEARAAELAAIQTEKPRCNVADVPSDRVPGEGAANWEVTKNRVVRIPDDEWEEFGTLVGPRKRTQVIRALMAWYMRRPGAKLPERPPKPPAAE